MTIRVDTAEGSAYWASYLINGDDSGIEPRDAALCDAWLESLGRGAMVVDCAEESHFSWSYGMICGDGSCSGGELLEYTIHYHD